MKPTIKKEYPVIAKLADIFKAIGIITLIIAIIVLIYAFKYYTLNVYAGLDIQLKALFSAFIVGLPFIAISYTLPIIAKIEINSRQNNISEKINKSIQSESFENKKETEPQKNINDYYAEIKKRN